VSNSQDDHPVDIVADDRERTAEVIAFFRGIPGVSVRTERLLSGDYLADRRILFERKTLQDLVISVVNGRFFKQMVALIDSPVFPARALQ
jgi:ERCC4-type nuclease